MKIATLHLSNNVILAPMAGITDLPYRLVMKRFGAGLVFTEMVSANGLIRDGRRTMELLRSLPHERPLGVQLFGDDPQTLAQAAQMVEAEADLIDLNLGCPVSKVVRSGAGSALLRDPAKVGRIVAAVRRATARPLTVKLRSGWDGSSLNYLEVARIAVAEGADSVTLHPRTRSQGFSGQANWEHIRRLRESLQVPVVGSGDLFTADDGAAMLAETGCEGVMIGRGGYGNPWLIRDLLGRLQGRTCPPPSPHERMEVALWHFDLFHEMFGERKTASDMRKHLCWYARGLAGAAAFRAAVNQTGSASALRRLAGAFFLTAEEQCHGQV